MEVAVHKKYFLYLVKFTSGYLGGNLSLNNPDLESIHPSYNDNNNDTCTRSILHTQVQRAAQIFLMASKR